MAQNLRGKLEFHKAVANDMDLGHTPNKKRPAHIKGYRLLTTEEMDKTGSPDLEEVVL